MSLAFRIVRVGAIALALQMGAAVLQPAAAQRMMGQMIATHAYIGAITLGHLYNFENGTEVDQLDGMMLGGQAGFGVTPTLSVVANYGTNSTMLYLKDPLANTLGEAFNHKVLLWDVNLQFRKPSWHERFLNPVLQLGAGQIRTTTSPGSNPTMEDVRSVPAYNAGLGVDLQFGNMLGLRIMAKDYITTTSWQNTADPRFNFSTSEAMSHNLAYHVGITLGF